MTFNSQQDAPREHILECIDEKRQQVQREEQGEAIKLAENTINQVEDELVFSNCVSEIASHRRSTDLLKASIVVDVNNEPRKSSFQLTNKGRDDSGEFSVNKSKKRLINTTSKHSSVLFHDSDPVQLDQFVNQLDKEESLKMSLQASPKPPSMKKAACVLIQQIPPSNATHTSALSVVQDFGNTEKGVLKPSVVQNKIMLSVFDRGNFDDDTMTDALSLMNPDANEGCAAKIECDAWLCFGKIKIKSKVSFNLCTFSPADVITIGSSVLNLSDHLLAQMSMNFVSTPYFVDLKLTSLRAIPADFIFENNLPSCELSTLPATMRISFEKDALLDQEDRDSIRRLIDKVFAPTGRLTTIKAISIKSDCTYDEDLWIWSCDNSQPNLFYTQQKGIFESRIKVNYEPENVFPEMASDQQDTDGHRAFCDNLSDKRKTSPRSTFFSTTHKSISQNQFSEEYVLGSTSQQQHHDTFFKPYQLRNVPSRISKSSPSNNYNFSGGYSTLNGETGHALSTLSSAYTFVLNSLHVDPFIDDSAPSYPLFMYPDNQTPAAQIVTSKDLLRLAPGKYLNDTLVEIELMRIMLQVKDFEFRSRIFHFSTFFYRKLCDALIKTGNAYASSTANAAFYKLVSRWTNLVENIFDKDLLIVPINENLHWFLLLIIRPHNMIVDAIDSEMGTKDHETLATKDNRFDELSNAGLMLQPERTFNSIQCSSEIAQEEKFKSDFNLPYTSTSDEEENDDDDNSLSILYPRLLSANADQLSSTTIVGKGKGPDASVTITPTRDVYSDRTCIVVYDSLGPRRSKKLVVRRLTQFLVQEATQKHGLLVDTKRIVAFNLHGPYQRNSYDCALYMLSAVETLILREGKEAFKEDNHLVHEMRTKDFTNWFPHDQAIEKRTQLLSMLKQMYSEHKKQGSNLDKAEDEQMTTCITDDDDVMIIDQQ